MTDENLFKVPAPNVGGFEKRVEKLNRRAKKLGLDPLTLTDEGEVVEHEKRILPSGREVTVVRHYRNMRLTGQRPKLNGWTMLGSVQHDTGAEGTMNVLQAAPGQEIPEIYRNAACVCDHCNTKRRRRETFIIQGHGTIRQIGRNCLQDFLGSDVSPKGIAWYYETWHAVTSGNINGRNDSTDYVGVVEFLAAAHRAIRAYGFVSKTAIMNGAPGLSTAGVAWGVLFPKPRDENVLKIEDQDYEAAADVLEWLRNEVAQRSNLHGYLANLVAATQGGWTRMKNAGLLASAFRARENEERSARENEERRQAAANREQRWAEERSKESNDYLGKVKDRIEGEFKVLYVREHEGDWGPWFSMGLKDATGNQAVLTGTRTPNVDVDDTIRLRATIKKLETKVYKVGPNKNITYLTRGKIQ